MAKKLFPFAVDPDIERKLRELAEAEGIARAAWIKKQIKEHYKELAEVR